MGKVRNADIRHCHRHYQAEEKWPKKVWGWISSKEKKASLDAHGRVKWTPPLDPRTRYPG